jgi:4-amino-4-deoxy-L-arabinose transferase-like glycosyltransferase
VPRDTDRVGSPFGVVVLWLCLAATVYAIVIAVTGGFTFQVAGFRVASHNALRPTLLALALAITAAWLLRRDARIRLEFLDAIVHRYGLAAAATMAGLIGAACFVFGAHIAFGADPSGYLSQARLWRAGELRVAIPVALEVDAIDPNAFAPLGYRASPTRGVAVPSYPPGLPLQFALVAAIAGERAQFAIPPLFAAGVVIMAFLLGRRVGGDETALIAAAASAASPMLLFQAVQPMSDVPATFWWFLAVLLLTYDAIPAALFAGLAAGIACVIRPNLFAMVPVLAILAAWWHGGIRPISRWMAFVMGPAIAAIAIAWLNYSWYGSAGTSGYGGVGQLFSIDHLWPNLARYPRWAIMAQSVLVVVPIAAPFVIRQGLLAPRVSQPRAVRLAWAALLLAVALQTFYLFYLVLDDWYQFRFLLPALPWLLVMQAAVLAALCRALPPPLRSLAVVVIAVLIASWGIDRARGLGAFRLRNSEHRYLEVAGFARTLPTDAVFMTVHHSGSLSYYASAAVLRWDWLDPENIDRVVSQLQGRGRRVYAVIDDVEEPRFRGRFAGTRTAAQLNTPVFSGGSRGGITSNVYLLTE